MQVDLGDARIVRSLLERAAALSPPARAELQAALAAKDASAVAECATPLGAELRQSLVALVGLYGDAAVLDEAEAMLPALPGLCEALSGLRWLADQLSGIPVGFDLADLRGYAYYSGARFGIYVPGASDALVRGGRYDEVGAVFGRNRPAVGFSLDVRELVGVVQPRALQAAIRAPWGEDPAALDTIRRLRRAGETVVCALPGHESEVDEFRCDRELVADATGTWTVRPC
jgi:ATP phosphoribosyltransferase regulatory subunit